MSKKINSKSVANKKKKIVKKSNTKKEAPASKKNLRISDEDIFKRSSEILSRSNSDGSIAMIRVDSDKNFYTLDGIAANVWQLLNGKNSLKKIKVKLSRQHTVDLDAISRDTDVLIKKLLSHSLIKIEKAK
jgi:hypothetical protein